MYDYLVVGSGLYGAIFAHEAKKAGKTVLVVDKRPNIGGNIFTEKQEGINVHKYGAHIFHTNNKKVWRYITQFAEFNRFTNSPVANYKGELFSMPFNMYTFNKMWGVVTPEEAAKKIEELSKQYGLNVDPYAKIENISVGMQQRVEILKMLYRNANVLIFDEPTAVLTPSEIDELISIMKNMTKEGKSIILITHKLKEIKEAANRCTVIRRGKYIGTVDVKDTTEADMAKMMVGREVSFKVEKTEAKPKDIVVKIEDLCVNNNKKVLGLKNFSLDIRAGEIVGIAGVEGNGQTELVEALTGMRSVESGNIIFKGRNIVKDSIRERIDDGMAHIPEDRHKRGLILDYTMEDNMVLKAYKKKPFSNKGLINRAKISEYAQKIIETFDVRSGEGGKSIARSLSGGNQQKGVIGREIESNPDFLIAVQPTRGLDVGSIEYIHKRLVEQRDLGKAVLLVSLELDEVLNVSDRIAVVNNGELVGIVNASETNENEVGLMMAGIKKEEA